MSLTFRWVMSGFSLFGILLFSNYINDAETHVLSSLVIVAIYQVILAIIGAASYFIGKNLNLIDDVVSTDENLVSSPNAVEEFDIYDISFDGSRVVGHFGGKEIYDTAKISFNNGLQKEYKFADTIKYENLETLDVSKLKPGSVVLDPGIVYEPK